MKHTLSTVNPNYCFTVVKLDDDILLKGRDFIVHKNILGAMVITQKGSFPKGSLGLYINVESQLSADYCYNNNLYTDKELNLKPTVKGYISPKKRRVKAISLGEFESNGLLMPLDSLNFLNLDLEFNLGDEFDSIDGIILCEKYIPPKNEHSPMPEGLDFSKKPSKLVDNQFKYHIDTKALGKYMTSIFPDTIVHLSYKLHGTSGISSNVLVTRPLNFFERVLKNIFKVNIVTSCYDKEGLIGSRKKVLNEFKDFSGNSYRKLAHEKILSHLRPSMTAYYEIVGYTETGRLIQKNFDYGFERPKTSISELTIGDSVIYDNSIFKILKFSSKTEVILKGVGSETTVLLNDVIPPVYQEGIHFGVYIYRLTYTSALGDVFEFTAKQVQEWCEMKNLKAVPELYYGSAKDLIPEKSHLISEDLSKWREAFMEAIREKYWFNQCYMTKSKVPSEGVVVRDEKLGLRVRKYKNFAFLKYETVLLEKGEVDIESDN